MSVEKIEQNWIVNVNKDIFCFFIVIDNWYGSGEEIVVWKELDFISYWFTRNHHQKVENTIVVLDVDGSGLKVMIIRFYLSSFYNEDVISIIMNTMYKQRSLNFIILWMIFYS